MGSSPLRRRGRLGGREHQVLRFLRREVGFLREGSWHWVLACSLRSRGPCDHLDEAPVLGGDKDSVASAASAVC